MQPVNYDWNKFTVFRRKERAAIHAAKSSIVGITTLIGLPSLSILIWQGINWGYQLGATAALLGIFSGGAAGAVIGGVIASIVFVAVIALVYFKLSKWLLQAWRRLSQGSENYRFLKQECKQDSHHEIAQMIEIAKQLKVLQRNGVRFPQNASLYAGLTPIQYALFKNIFNVILGAANSDQAELDIARNKTLHGLRKDRRNELLQRVRAIKAQALFQYQHPPQNLPAAIQDGITAGKSPWAFFHKIRDWFYPHKSLRQQGLMITSTMAIAPEILQCQPHHTQLDSHALIYSLLQLEPSKIAEFAPKLLQIEANYAQQLPEDLYQEIQRQNVVEETATDAVTKARAEKEMTYLVGNPYRHALTWMNQDKTFLQAGQDPAPAVEALRTSSAAEAEQQPVYLAPALPQRISKAPVRMSRAELASYLSYLKSQKRDAQHSLRQQREMEFAIVRTEKLMNSAVG